MSTDFSQLYEDRWVEPDLDVYLGRMGREVDSRSLASRLVVESVETAHALDPHLWGLSKSPDHVRLNFGAMIAISWTRTKFTLMADLPTLRETASPELLALARFRKDGSVFPGAPDSRYLDLPMNDSAAFSTSLQEVRRAHRRHLDVAASSGLNAATRKGHHPGLLDAISTLGGRSLPQPAYVGVRR